MVNEEIVEYIQDEEKEGYTDKELKKILISEGGWSEQEVDEAIKHAHNEDLVHKDKKCHIKERNPWLIITFSIITLGIYGIYWMVSTTNELINKTDNMLSPWWLLGNLIPIIGGFVMIYYLWKYSESINQLTGYNTSILFLLWVFIPPVGMFISQKQLNKKTKEE